MQNGPRATALDLSRLAASFSASTVEYVVGNQQDGYPVIAIGRGTTFLLRMWHSNLGESREL